jgi:hypothetical protein
VLLLLRLLQLLKWNVERLLLLCTIVQRHQCRVAQSAGWLLRQGSWWLQQLLHHLLYHLPHPLHHALHQLHHIVLHSDHVCELFGNRRSHHRNLLIAVLAQLFLLLYQLLSANGEWNNRIAKRLCS